MPNEITELIDRTPKVVTPTTHGVIDYLVVAAFFIAAGACWDDNKRASIAALANGAAVLGTSMFTDYWGDGRKPISFKMHGKIDVGQMIAAATVPAMLGFAGEGPAAFFFSQAASEAGVLAMTDFSAADRQARRLEAA